MIGTVINDRYRIDSDVGSGGMADVYRAYDLQENRSVALKLIKKEYCEDPKHMRRFEREARAAMTLDCPNIVRAFDFGEYEGRNFIVLEFVEGMTLKQYLEIHGKLSPRAAVHIAGRVLTALECAHEGNYVHRDVKPQNVLISVDRTIKLTDFGIAKDTGAATQTFDGKNVVGSVQYISPEQASGKDVSAQSDLYSVGIMLYEMLIGEPPFDGDNSVQIAVKHINERLTPPMELDPSISPALRDVVVKATAENLNVRYKTAGEMKADLQRALREPEERFAYVDPEEVMVRSQPAEQQGETESGARLWHFLLPASLMVALVIGMFVFWYSTMFKDSKNAEMSKVPNLIERTLIEAEELLNNRDFVIRLAGTVSDPDYPEGTVCRQSPESGTSYKKGSTVDVWLSSGASTVAMQYLIGMSLDEATAMLDELGIGIDSITYDASSTESDGTVTWQSIPEGTEVVPGEETVSLEVAGYQGASLVPMPDLAKVATLGGIDQILDVYGVVNRRFLKGETMKGSSNATGLVESQSPSAGLPFLPSDTTVEIYLYEDLFQAASAEVEFEMLVDRDGTSIEVVLESEYGEFVLYQTVLDRSENAASVHFHAGFLQAGEYTLVVYSDRSETMRFTAVFTA